MSTPPGRPGENDSEMSLEQKLRPRGLAEWTAVLAAVALGVSVPSRLFDATRSEAPASPTAGRS